MTSTNQASEERPPFYDPAVHTDANQVVYAELCSTSGRIWRQRDPVRLVEPMVRGWITRELEQGHEPASKADAVAERERRRKAAFVAVGRERDYQPREYAHLNTGDTTVRPWPVFPDNQEV